MTRAVSPERRETRAPQPSGRVSGPLPTSSAQGAEPSYRAGRRATHSLRILITGSRDWTDRAAIALAISEWLESQGSSIGGAYPIPTVIHGAASGADHLAADVAVNWGFAVEPHLADWNRYGKAAGPLRNQAMVDSGADVVLAFPLGESRGTRDCIRRAEKAGIPVRVIANA